ncbi:MAG TPA: pyridoxal 5'-phosphate synthase [Galbitalea sp.]|jgi:pyridoxamine 5'-phosphate oxidase
MNEDSAASKRSWRQVLRDVPTVKAELPRFDTDVAPADPLVLFGEWLETAIAGGVLQPLAMSLATVSPSGAPAVRTLILKDLDATSLWFSSLSSGPKGADLEAHPAAALVFYWREQGRQIRVSGLVEAGPRDVSENDFLQRQPNARARAIAGRQSEAVEDFDAHLAAGQAVLERNPAYVPEAWVAYRLVPEWIEFWQAELERDQVRLRYERTGDKWHRHLLWP